ncbi:MAG: ISAs1 family transposase [Chloroflexi bacterium]|nr:ISAs1 family transposase [Chloroflexota bacterium]
MTNPPLQRFPLQVIQNQRRHWSCDCIVILHVINDHGQLQCSQCRAITDPEELAYVDSQRRWVSFRQNAATDGPTDTRYYICSYPVDAATLVASRLRHLSIENRLHWVLDVAFDEDHSRVRTGHADLNRAVMRLLALNLNQREDRARVSIIAKRKRVGWGFDYLLKALSQ